MDWSVHPLGDPALWPIELKTAIRTALTSRFPNMVHWGEQLFTFYNDGYAAMIGRKHPGHLGQPAKEWWSEMWDQLTPFFERVLAGESFYTEDALYTPDRDGQPQNAYFTHSHSPLWNDAGVVRGIVVMAVETTARVEAELGRASDERRNRQVLDSAIDYAIIATNTDGLVTRWNEGACRILGWTEEEMLGQTAERFFTPEDVANGRLETEMAAALECGRGNDERWHQRKSGERFWAQGEMTVLRNEAGHHEGFVKVLRDRTEQHLIRTKLEASEARFQMALGAAGFIGSWDWDVKADRIYADAHFADFYSVSAEEAENGLPLATFVAGIHPDDRGWVGDRIAETVAKCGDFAEEYRLLKPDGSVAWVFARGSCICDEEGKPSHFPGVAVEITGRRAMEEALRSNEARIRLALEAADMGTWQSSPELRELDWDARARVLLSHGPEEQLDFGSFLDRVHPDDRSRVESEVGDALSADAAPLDTEFRMTSQGSGFHWVHARGALVAGADKQPRFIGTVRDITPQKAAEEQSALLAYELNHRIKNTLAVVQSIVSQSLRRADTPEQASDAIGERLGALGRAHDLLTQTSWAAASLQSVVESATQVSGRAAKRVVAEGPEVRLNAKAALAFSMALHELTTNAIKYGALSIETGSVEVRWLKTTREGSRVLELVWAENGGPAVTTPERTGFGSRLMRGLSRDLGGEGQPDYRPTGFRWHLRADLAKIEEPLTISVA